jgi:hypothetical protein
LKPIHQAIQENEFISAEKLNELAPKVEALRNRLLQYCLLGIIPFSIFNLYAGRYLLHCKIYPGKGFITKNNQFS